MFIQTKGRFKYYCTKLFLIIVCKWHMTLKLKCFLHIYTPFPPHKLLANTLPKYISLILHHQANNFFLWQSQAAYCQKLVTPKQTVCANCVELYVRSVLSCIGPCKVFHYVAFCLFKIVQNEIICTFSCRSWPLPWHCYSFWQCSQSWGNYGSMRTIQYQI